MARARSLKPGFFRNADLAELPFETRLLFPGLWVLADRAGRLEDRPKQIKMEIFPADNVDIDSMLDQLVSAGVIIRYEVDSKRYIQVINFDKHQNPHKEEKASTIPAPCEHCASTVQAPCEFIDSTMPIVLTPDSLNLTPDSLKKPFAQKPRADYSEDFLHAWAKYPARPGANKQQSFKAWNARIKDGADATAMICGVERYAAYVKAMGISPEYIKQPATFFGPDRHYESDWTPTPQGNSYGNAKQSHTASLIAELTGANRQRESAVFVGTAERVD